MGDILKIDNIIKDKKVPVIYPSTTIYDALHKMNQWDLRRLPVVDAGSNRIEGILTAMDIVDFMGGGSKYNLVKLKHDRNLYSAINEPVKEIMTPNPICIKEGSDLSDVLDLFINNNVGGLPVVDKDNRFITTITERDVLRYLIDEIDKNITIENYMTTEPITATLGERLKDVARTMLRNGFRRLPIVSEGKLVGMITSTDFIKLLGSDWAFNHLKTGNVREITNVRMEEIGTKDAITLKVNTSLYDGVSIMISNGIGALPVVDDSNHLIGIITEKDAIKYFYE